MKRILALVLAFVMLGSLCTGILAASVENCSDAACAHVAAIGTTHYDTLAEAVAAVQVDVVIHVLDEHFEKRVGQSICFGAFRITRENPVEILSILIDHRHGAVFEAGAVC